MQTNASTGYTHPRKTRAETSIRAVARILWQALRLPVLAVLLVLEPFISLILVGAAAIGIIAGLTLRCSGDIPDFPFWTMAALSLGAILLLMAYHILITVLSR